MGFNPWLLIPDGPSSILLTDLFTVSERYGNRVTRSRSLYLLWVASNPSDLPDFDLYRFLVRGFVGPTVSFGPLLGVSSLVVFSPTKQWDLGVSEVGSDPGSGESRSGISSNGVCLTTWYPLGLNSPLSDTTWSPTPLGVGF